MAAEVPQTLEYRGGQLNAPLVLELVKGSQKDNGLTDNEEDTRSSQEYLNDLEEEHQARALLAKFKRFFKKGTQRFSSAKATDQAECHKYGRKELRPTKDFKAKYNKVKAKLALLNSSALASKSLMVKNKDLVVETYECDEEEVTSDDNEMVEVKVLMALADDNDAVSKKGTRNGEWVNISMRKCDIRKPIWYLDSGCSRHMVGVKSYLHKYVEQPGPKVVFGDDSACTTEGYDFIKCNGIVFTKVAFVNGLKYNLVSISQLCDAKYIVRFNEKSGTILNSNKEVVMIAPRVRDVYVLDMTSFAQESCFFAKAFENINWLWHKRLAHLNFKTINKLAKQNLIIGLPSLVYSKDKPCSSCEKEKHHRARFKTKQTSSIKKCLHLLHMDLFGHKKSQAPETIMSFIKRVENQNDILRTDNVYIHNHKDHFEKFDEKAYDGYFLGYSLVSKAFKVFNTRRQQTKETYHITFDESPDGIKFTKPSVDNINIVGSERYPPDEYLHPYEPSQRYQTNSNDVSFIEPYESPEPVVLETEVPSNQNGQTYHNDHNDQSIKTDEILDDDQFKHSNHTNDEQIIDNLLNTKDIYISELLSSLNVKDTSVHDTISIPNPSLSIPSMTSPAPQDKWSQYKHIELINIIGDSRAGMLTRAMAKELSAASAHECLFVDILSEEEPKSL
ncbi:retrovirus-related pol polyprotein from transposon TNT 1-94 [Tanacetum coccineum]